MTRTLAGVGGSVRCDFNCDSLDGTCAGQPKDANSRFVAVNDGFRSDELLDRQAVGGGMVEL